MISVPKRFAGFRSAQSLLNDPSLTEDQKKTALVAWRTALQQAVPPSTQGGNDTARMILDIDAALERLGNEPRKHRGFS